MRWIFYDLKIIVIYQPKHLFISVLYPVCSGASMCDVYVETVRICIVKFGS